MLFIQFIEKIGKHFDMMNKRGLLVVFEGLDRSGKSTQARKLIESLTSQGHKAKFMRFPGMLSGQFSIVVIRKQIEHDKKIMII